MSVHEVDFGKDRNVAAALFARLLGLAEARSADILARPEFYLGQATDEIRRLRDALASARDALRPPVAHYIDDEHPPCARMPEIVRVEADRLARLEACAKIVREVAP